MSEQKTVTEAFDILRSAIEQAIKSIKDKGSDAMRQGNFDDTEKIIAEARQLETIKNDLETLQIAFKNHINIDPPPDAKNNMREKIRKNIRTINHRNRSSDRTPEDAYYRPILESLVALGGSARTRDVLNRVYEIMKDQLSEHDHQRLSSSKKEIRWYNAAKWARNTLCNQGLMRTDSPNGIWEISEQGIQWLENNK
jgi:hypothetical protein